MSRNNPTPDVFPAESEPARGQSGPERSWGRIAVLSLLAIIAVAGAGLGAMQIPAVRGLFAQEVGAARTAEQLNLPETPFLAHAREAGIKACGAVFPILGQLLTNGAQYNIQSDWNAAAPDKYTIRSLVGMNFAGQDYTGPAAGLVVASPNGSGCEGAMVRIVPFQQACESVVRMLPEGTARRSELGQVAAFNLANNGGQLMLLPSGQSCVAISISQAALN